MNSETKPLDLYEIYALVKKFHAKYKNAPIEHILLIQNDGTHVEKSGDAGSVDFTTYISKTVGGGLIHNHPNGGAFSPDDIRTCGLLQLSWMVATTKDGFYIITANNWRNYIGLYKSAVQKYKKALKDLRVNTIVQLIKHIKNGGDASSFDENAIEEEFKKKWDKFLKHSCCLRALSFKFIPL